MESNHYLSTQHYLHTYGLEKLEKDFSIQSKVYDDVIVLNYNPYESPKFNPIVDECRGLILDKDSLNVLSKGFNRFYNDFEIPDIEKFNFRNAIVTEKLDGTYISIWWDYRVKKWQASTRRCAYCEGSANGNITFKDLVNRAIGDIQEKFNTLTLPKDITYIFELVSPEARIITPYDKTEMYLLAMIERSDGFDHSFKDVVVRFAENLLKVKTPKILNYTSLEEIKKGLDELNTTDEGYVCIFENDRNITPGRRVVARLKTKNRRYFELASLSDGLTRSNRKIIDNLLNGNYIEYIEAIPELKQCFDKCAEARKKLIEDVERCWCNVQNIEDRGDFAKVINSEYKKYQVFLFAMKDGKSIDNVLEKMSSKVRANMIGEFL
jgi:hypothetical protein